MKRLLSFIALGFSAATLLAANAPTGSVMELHSCEVYAGPCVVSSESPEEGRSMVRMWEFEGGSFNGVDFHGLRLAVLQSSPDNLADSGSKSGDAIVYLPQDATASQRTALLSWLKASQADFHPTKIESRIVPIRFTRSQKGYGFSAGEFVSVKTAALSDCAMGNCGETLWYHPRTATSIYTVAVNSSSEVSEPLLKLRWNSSGNRSIFLARFGDTIPAKNLYVNLSELCGPTNTLF